MFTFAKFWERVVKNDDNMLDAIDANDTSMISHYENVKEVLEKKITENGNNRMYFVDYGMGGTVVDVENCYNRETFSKKKREMGLVYGGGFKNKETEEYMFSLVGDSCLLVWVK